MTRKTVLFDMDGTLVDSEGFHYVTMASAVESFGHTLPDGFADRITGMTIGDCHTLLKETIGFSAPLDALTARKYALYVEGAKGLVTREGARTVIDRLDASGVAWAIVSNSDRMIADANLTAVGLHVPGLITVTRNDVRFGKPRPEPYLRAAWLLGVDPSDCIVVEDSTPGARAGHAAGMTVIGWPEPHRADIAFPPGTLIADPHDLAATLLPLLSASSTRIA